MDEEMDEATKEQVKQAVARMIYEHETRRDWYLAKLEGHDPGLDPAWRNKVHDPS